MERREKEKSLWAKIGESSVIIGAVLIFAGFLRQYWYYHHFGIPIHQYLSLDEVLILFFDDLVYILYLVLLIVGYIIFLGVVFKIVDINAEKKRKKQNTLIPEDDISVESEDHGSQEPELSLVDHISENLFKDRKSLNVALIVALIMSIISIGVFLFTKSTFSVVFFALTSCQALMIFITWLTDNEDHELIYIGSILAGLIILLACKNDRDVIQTESQYNKYTYTIKTNDRVIHTSRDTLFLGQTKDYLFLFNTKQSEDIIIKRENVSLITKKNKELPESKPQ